MSIHALTHNDIDDRSQIIAIHSALEPFDLAFKINDSLGLKLIRSEFDISFKKKEEKYMVYKDENCGDGSSAWLYSNSFTGSKFNSANESLFKEESIELSLMPEFSKADYILKRSGESSSLESFVGALLLLPEISSCYMVPENKIKSKHNLILD
jgi:hypothetical protein|tara:strand:+ start:114 stop:575 length:462 start_codon:yes stop_codon:yes gene_type:complete